MTQKMWTMKPSEYDEEQLAVAMLLNPSIRTRADMVRAGIANVIESSASLEQIARARRQVRKQREAQA